MDLTPVARWVVGIVAALVIMTSAALAGADVLTSTPDTTALATSTTTQTTVTGSTVASTQPALVPPTGTVAVDARSDRAASPRITPPEASSSRTNQSDRRAAGTASPTSATDTTIVIECVMVDGVEANHGATVSEYARETPPGPEHGEVVRQAAHSDCGKPDDAIGVMDPVASTGDDQPQPTNLERRARHDDDTDHGNGHAHGKSGDGDRGKRDSAPGQNKDG